MALEKMGFLSGSQSYMLSLETSAHFHLFSSPTEWFHIWVISQEAGFCYGS